MARKDAQPGVKEAAAERRVQALELRKKGLDYRTIGRRLGISHGQACKDVHSVLRELARMEKKKGRELRQLETERLNQMLEKLETRIETGDPEAIRTAIKIQERRAKLFGMDAPKQVELGNKDGVPFKVYRDVEPDKV